MLKKKLISGLHQNTSRDYFLRMTPEKPEQMEVAKTYGREYWDGERKFGYGGYVYDGRWKSMAQEIIHLYDLNENSSVLDLGCGKGHLIYEMKSLLPGLKVMGVDISSYALSQVPSKISTDVKIFDLNTPSWPFEKNQFDLVLSLNVFHNLHLKELLNAMKEIERIGKRKYLVVESYRNEKELTHLQCWALTCASFFHVDDWEFLLQRQGYTGDYEFIFFE